MASSGYKGASFMKSFLNLLSDTPINSEILFGDRRLSLKSKWDNGIVCRDPAKHIDGQEDAGSSIVVIIGLDKLPLITLI